MKEGQIPELLSTVFSDAFDEFLNGERSNIRSDVSERNLCGRLMLYLDRSKDRHGLKEYYADIEYNRKQRGELKTIVDEQMKVISITCDLILHSRGESIERDNLIAIEMKKAGRPKTERDSDHTRLRAMTKRSFNDIWSNDGTTHPEHVCGYEIGYFIELDIQRRVFAVDVFRKGKQIDTFEGQL